MSPRSRTWRVRRSTWRWRSSRPCSAKASMPTGRSRPHSAAAGAPGTGTGAGPRPDRPAVHQPERLRPVPLARLDRPAAPSAPRGPAAPGLAPRRAPGPPRLPGLGPRDRPRPGPARRPGRCAQLDRAGRGTEALARRPRRHRRPLAALPRLAPRTPAAAPQRGHAQGPLPRAAPRHAGPAPPLGPRPDDEGKDKVKADAAAALWTELRDGGVKPWVHRHIPSAAKLPADSDVHHLPAFERGALEIQDLASQAVALACDPDPGERWWDACAGAGGKALHLAALMGGKGVVVATDVNAGEAQGSRPPRPAEPLPQPHDQALGRPPRRRQAEELRRRPGRRPLLRPRHLEAQPQRALDHPPRGHRPPRRAPVRNPPRRRRRRQTRRHPGLLGLHPDPHRDPRRHPPIPRNPPRLSPRPLSSPLLPTPTPNDGTLLIWPQDADTDAMFIARMVRTS